MKCQEDISPIPSLDITAIETLSQLLQYEW